jgi:hypothetical protein
LRGRVAALTDTLTPADSKRRALYRELRDVVEMLGDGDIELVDIDWLRQLASDTLGQAERTAGAGQHDLGTFLLSEGRNPERQRGIGEDAGDHDVLAVEQTHGSDRSHAGVISGD